MRSLLSLSLLCLALGACSDDNEASPAGSSGQGGAAGGGAAGGASGGGGLAGAGGSGGASAGSGGVSAGSGGAAGESGSAGAAGSESLPFCGKAGISKGPWVVSVSETSAVVRWETCAPGATKLSYVAEAGGDPTEVEGTSSSHEIVIETKSLLDERGADLAGEWWLHEVTLAGLTPSTCYGYQAAGEAMGRLCTARQSGEPVRFAFIADTNPGLSEKQTAHLFERINAFQPDFTLHGGDMQYYSSALEPYSWWFGAMSPVLRAGAMWPAVGNHESEKENEFEDYYTRFWGKIGLDNQDDSYHFDSGGVHFFSLNTEANLKPGSPQLAWVEAQLAAAKQKPGFRFSVVFFHRPLITCGDTGELTDEREALRPLFQAHGVKLTLAGHMHGYERFDVDGIPWLVAGGGGSLPGDVDANPTHPFCGQRQAKGVFPHAVFVEVTAGKLSGKVLDDKDAERDVFTIDVP